ncbi:MAG: hypothetical protein AB1403_21030 [Candidatus Riflebacteria bacterium]
MIVKLKTKSIDFSDLSPKQQYFVIGIEADDYRIINDHGKPYLYPQKMFEIINSNEPSDWVTEYGDDGERYSYPEILNRPGFFEDYFNGDPEAFSKFWQLINSNLSRAA